MERTFNKKPASNPFLEQIELKACFFPFLRVETVARVYDDATPHSLPDDVGIEILEFPVVGQEQNRIRVVHGAFEAVELAVKVPGVEIENAERVVLFSQLVDNREGGRLARVVDVTLVRDAPHAYFALGPDEVDDEVDDPQRHRVIHLARAPDQPVGAAGILNAPDPSFDPEKDSKLIRRYSAKNYVTAKRENKRFLQKTLGLIQDDRAPLFFWPSRLDTIQKGCQLLADILYHVVSSYWEQNLEIVFVANGEFQGYFKEIVGFHNLQNRVAVCNFDENLARLAYGASDFILMPSRFEPCGLPQMIGPIYGSLPVAHDTGGIHDTITHLDTERNTGNGFLFETHDSGGLFWAIQQAMIFYGLPQAQKKRQIKRIMTQSAAAFNHAVTARHYIELYEKMLMRPLINPPG